MNTELIKLVSENSIILIIISFVLFFSYKYINMKLRFIEQQLEQQSKPHFFEVWGTVEQEKKENKISNKIELKVQKKSIN